MTTSESIQIIEKAKTDNPVFTKMKGLLKGKTANDLSGKKYDVAPELESRNINQTEYKKMFSDTNVSEKDIANGLADMLLKLAKAKAKARAKLALLKLKK